MKGERQVGERYGGVMPIVSSLVLLSNKRGEQGKGVPQRQSEESKRIDKGVVCREANGTSSCQ
jgi:hypothetical protein